MVFSKLFGADKTPVAGVDISQDYIIFTKLIREDNKIKLQTLASVETPEGSFSSGAVTRPEVIGEIIRKIVTDNELGEIKINFAIQPNVPFIRTVTLPDLPFEELKTFAQEVAASNIPFPLSEANIDYAVLPDTRRVAEGNKRVVDVMIIALQKAVAQRYVDIGDTAKIRVNSIDLAPFSMLKTLANSTQITENKSVDVSVFVGYDHTDISIIINGMPIFNHGAPIGKKNIIETISAGLGLDAAATNNFLPQVAILVPGLPSPTDPQAVKAATMVRMIYNNIAAEISKAIQFYKTQRSTAPEINKIFLGGNGMCITNADKFIANRLKVESELVDTFKNIEVTPEQLENQDLSTLVTSVGLALKGL